MGAAALLPGVILWGKAWQIDEPFFLALARRILEVPGDPLGFTFNWYGHAQPMAKINNTPPLFLYLLAGVMRLSGGVEYATRALFFPFDLAAAWGLLALAGRFLKRPLWPTLAVVLGPAWVININHAMPERVMAGLAFPALWLLVVGVEEKNRRAYWGAAVLASLALLTKVNAIFILGPGLAWTWSRGVPLRRIAGWGVVALAGLALGSVWSAWAGGGAGAAVWNVTKESAAMLSSAPSHRLRALLAFTGGLAPWVMICAWALKPSHRMIAVVLFVGALLYAPWFDLAQVLPADRVAGFLMGGSALVLTLALVLGPRTRGRALWLSWIGAVVGLQFVYWSVVARFILFLLPPLAFWAAERLEKERLWMGGAVLSLLLSVACASVDWRHAESSRAMAVEVVAPAVESGRRVWCAGHWGLQEYMTRAGARMLDSDRGGWDEVRVGDMVVVPGANTNVLRPTAPLRADKTTYAVPFALPVRLISGWRGEGGFYSSAMGFLPWSPSTEPVEVFTVVSPL